jgi:hypothetical protein
MASSPSTTPMIGHGRYSIWKNRTTGDYEVVRWVDSNDEIVVQANIKTRAKAVEARKNWEAREDERNGQ